MSFVKSYSLDATRKVYAECDNSHLEEMGIPGSFLKRKTIVTETKAVYEMINYIPPESDDQHVQPEYKSVIFEPTTKRIMCFSPPKSATMRDFIRNLNDNPAAIDVEEAVEGTMINLFYDTRIQKWEIATKGNIGCHYWYFRTQYPNPEMSDYNIIPSQKTFRQMFIDAFQTAGDEYRGCEEDINDIAFLAELPKEYCYSFVLAHPDNHLVHENKTAKLTLVGVYLPIFRCLSGEPCHYGEGGWNEVPSVQVVNPETYLAWDCFAGNQGSPATSPFHKGKNSPIVFPTKYNDSIESILKIMNFPSTPLNDCETMLANAIANPEKTRVMGYMIRNLRTGDRVCVKTQEYKALKKLRGNNPNLQYHYFSLMKTGKLKEFLRHFPMYNLQFCMFYNQYHAFINQVYQAYVSYYILNVYSRAPLPAHNVGSLLEEKSARRLKVNVYSPDLLPAGNRESEYSTTFHLDYAANNPGSLLEENSSRRLKVKTRDTPIPKKYFIHAAKLHHDVYLSSCRFSKHDNSGSLTQPKKTITHRVVREYFDSMEAKSIHYYINYEFYSHH